MALFRPFFQKFSIVFLCLFRSAISKWQRTIAASGRVASRNTRPSGKTAPTRSEEHTSELQSLMRISYAVFCLKQKKINNADEQHNYRTQQPRKQRANVSTPR